MNFTRRNGAVLKLADSLSEEDDISHEVVVGQTSGGRYVTLLRANCTEAPMFRVTREFPCTYHAPALIIGCGFDTPDDVRFSVLQMRTSALSRWVKRHGFSSDASQILTFGDCPEVGFAYKTPAEQILLNQDELELAIKFFPLVRIVRDLRSIRQDVCVEIQQRTNQTLADYMKTVTRLEYLLALATDGLVNASSLNAIVQPPVDGAEGPVLVDIFYQPIRKAAQAHREAHLFTLADISGQEETCIGNWFAKADWLDPVCALYFGTLYNPSKYQDFNFLALVHAVEAYHRRVSNETDQPDAVHAARVHAILSAAPAEHRNWLTDKLKYSNELSLRRRLKMLFAQFAHAFEGLDLQPKAIVNTIYERRNRLTHNEPSLGSRPKNGVELLRLTEILKLLLQACLLSELGLPEEKSKEFILRSRSIRMIRHLNNVAATKV